MARLSQQCYSTFKIVRSCNPIKRLMHGLSPLIKAGEVHAIMGPEREWKSTLAATLMGHPKYKVTEGKVKFKGKDLLKMNSRGARGGRAFWLFNIPRKFRGKFGFAFASVLITLWGKREVKISSSTFVYLQKKC